MNVRELTYEQKMALTPEQRREFSFKSVEEANAALKAVRNYEDFQEFEFRLETCTGYFHHVDLCMKRSGYSTQSFSNALNPAKCHYLIMSGGTGTARWENLHRVMEVRIQWVPQPENEVAADIRRMKSSDGAHWLPKSKD